MKKLTFVKLNLVRKNQKSVKLKYYKSKFLTILSMGKTSVTMILVRKIESTQNRGP